MNKFTNENILREIKSSKKLFIISLVLLVVSIALILLGTKFDEKKQADILDLETIIQNKDTKEQNTYVEITPTTYQFAVYEGETDSFYIVTNDKYYYVAFMSDTYNDTVVSKSTEKTITLKGVAKVPPKDVKQLAIDFYNVGLEDEEKLTLSDYNNYFGDVYIDVTDNIDNGSFYYFAAILLFIGFLVILIIALCKKIMYKKSLKKIPDDLVFKLDTEMNDKDAFYYNKIKLYLTKNYIINFQGKFSYTDYKDILWIYPFEMRYNGVKTNSSIKLFTKDAKTLLVASIDPYSKKSKEIYDEIWNTIIEKNKDAWVGYTAENREKAKEYKKEMKHAIK